VNLPATAGSLRPALDQVRDLSRGLRAAETDIKKYDLEEDRTQITFVAPRRSGKR
jgi:hypothetical protein